MGSLVGALSSAFKGSPSLQGLQKNGYQMYQATPQVGLNMGAYGPDQAAQSQAAQINMGQANRFLSGQQGLVNSLQAQAAGQGPNIAQQQLQQATQANIQGQAAQAASQMGNQNPGLAAKQLGENAAMIQQNAAGQSGLMRSQQQLAAQGQLGSVLGQASAQQQGLAENQAGMQQQTNLSNMSAENNMAQFNTSSAQQGNNAQQAQYQYANTLAAGQQSNQNAAIAGQALQNQAAGNAMLGGAVNATGGIIAGAVQGGGNNPSQNDQPASPDNSGDTTGGGVPSDFARGGLLTHPTVAVVGEKGPEVVVPLNKRDPHAFLAAMMKRHAQGGGQSPGTHNPEGDAALAHALASASGNLHSRVSALEAARK